MSLIAERLRTARESLGFSSQAAIADAVGITREQWGRYERGQSVPGGDVLAVLALMGVDIAYVLTGKHTVTPSNEIALLHDYRLCDDAGKATIRHVAHLTRLAKQTNAPRQNTSESPTAGANTLGKVPIALT